MRSNAEDMARAFARTGGAKTAADVLENAGVAVAG